MFIFQEGGSGKGGGGGGGGVSDRFTMTAEREYDWREEGGLNLKKGGGRAQLEMQTFGGQNNVVSAQIYCDSPGLGYSLTRGSNTSLSRETFKLSAFTYSQLLLVWEVFIILLFGDVGTIVVDNIVQVFQDDVRCSTH